MPLTSGSAPVALAAVLAAAAVLVAVPPVRLPRARGPSSAPFEARATAPDPSRGPPQASHWPATLAALALAVAAVGGVAAATSSLVPAVLAGGAVAGLAAAGRRWHLRRRDEAVVRGRRRQVLALCDALSAELRGGSRPTDALSAATAELDDAADVLGPRISAALASGADVGAALRRLSRLPGSEGLRPLAACWRVATTRGAGLAEGVEHLARTLRSDEEVRAEVAAELAGPRASARVLALLPGIGLAVGSALGARPLDVLLTTPLGWSCLAAGGLLTGTGMWWVGRLVDAAEDGGDGPGRDAGLGGRRRARRDAGRGWSGPAGREAELGRSGRTGRDAEPGWRRRPGRGAE